jgi:hypothetical protein
MSSKASNDATNQVKPDIQRLITKNTFDGAPKAPLEVQQAIYLARELCRHARELQTPQERRQQAGSLATRASTAARWSAESSPSR